MLIDAYDLVMASPRLSMVKSKAFGDESELEKVGDSPRVVWVPTEDTYTGPDTLGQVPYIIEGKRVMLESIALRKAGCDVHLLTDYGVNGQRKMEDLIRQFLNAMHETLLSYSNYELEDAKWFPRKALFQKQIEVIQPIRVYIPIWSATPAQLLKKTVQNLAPLPLGTET